MWYFFMIAVLAQIADAVITAMGSAKGFAEGNPLRPPTDVRTKLGNWLWPFAAKLPVYIAIGVALYFNQPIGIWIVSGLAFVAGAWASWHNLKIMKVV